MYYHVQYGRKRKVFYGKPKAIVLKFAEKMLCGVDRSFDSVFIAAYRNDRVKSGQTEKYQMVGNITEKKGIFYKFMKVPYEG